MPSKIVTASRNCIAIRQGRGDLIGRLARLSCAHIYLLDQAAHVATRIPVGLRRLRRVIIVGRPRHQRIGSGVWCDETRSPLPKAVGAVILTESGGLPSCAAIGGKGDLFEPGIAAQCDTTNFSPGA